MVSLDCSLYAVTHFLIFSSESNSILKEQLYEFMDLTSFLAREIRLCSKGHSGLTTFRTVEEKITLVLHQ